MTIDELYTHLLEEGFGDLVRKSADSLNISDFCIQREGRTIRVGQMERNWFCAVDLETDDEAEACTFYLKGAMRFAWHLTHSSDESDIERQHAILTSAGVWVDRNDLPAYLNLPNSRYRIFVLGADLKLARQLLGL